MNGYDRHDSARPHTLMTGFYALSVVVLLTVAAVLLWHFWGNRPEGAGGGMRPVTARGDLAEDEKTTINIFRQPSPSVTHITRLATRRSYLTRVLRQIPEGTGSGF